VGKEARRFRGPGGGSSARARERQGCHGRSSELGFAGEHGHSGAPARGERGRRRTPRALGFAGGGTVISGEGEDEEEGSTRKPAGCGLGKEGRRGRRQGREGRPRGRQEVRKKTRWWVARCAIVRRVASYLPPFDFRCQACINWTVRSVFHPCVFFESFQIYVRANCLD
jgi:hypothetical protein